MTTSISATESPSPVLWHVWAAAGSYNLTSAKRRQLARYQLLRIDHISIASLILGWLFSRAYQAIGGPRRGPTDLALQKISKTSLYCLKVPPSPVIISPDCRRPMGPLCLT